MTKKILGFIFLIRFTSFKDFEDYWIIKVNNKYVNYVGQKIEFRTTYKLTYKLDSLTLKDSIEVFYFQDYSAGDKIHTYYLIENLLKSDSHVIQPKTHKYVQKSFDESSYKLSLLDIYKVGQKTNSKSIRYYIQDWNYTKELCRITFK
jgi:hypothetical protein